MPLLAADVGEIKDDIEDQLKREDFAKALPGTQIAYAAGNPQPANPENLEYIHIVKFVGLPAEPRPVSLTSILDDAPLPDDPLHRRHGNVKTWGQLIIENGAAAANGVPTANGASDTAAAAGAPLEVGNGRLGDEFPPR